MTCPRKAPGLLSLETWQDSEPGLIAAVTHDVGPPALLPRPPYLFPPRNSGALWIHFPLGGKLSTGVGRGGWGTIRTILSAHSLDT